MVFDIIIFHAFCDEKKHLQETFLNDIKVHIYLKDKYPNFEVGLKFNAFLWYLHTYFCVLVSMKMRYKKTLMNVT